MASPTSALGRGRPDGDVQSVRPVSARKLTVKAITDYAHLSAGLGQEWSPKRSPHNAQVEGVNVEMRIPVLGTEMKNPAGAGLSRAAGTRLSCVY